MTRTWRFLSTVRVASCKIRQTNDVVISQLFVFLCTRELQRGMFINRASNA